jgi:hypothetical protein
MSRFGEYDKTEFDNFEVYVENLNDDYELLNVCLWEPVEVNGETYQTIRYNSNLYLIEDKTPNYFDKYIDNYKDVIYNNSTYPDKYKIIDKLEGSTFALENLKLLLYREFETTGYMKYTVKEE